MEGGLRELSGAGGAGSGGGRFEDVGSEGLLIPGWHKAPGF